MNIIPRQTSPVKRTNTYKVFNKTINKCDCDKYEIVFTDPNHIGDGLICVDKQNINSIECGEIICQD